MHQSISLYKLDIQYTVYTPEYIFVQTRHSEHCLYIRVFLRTNSTFSTLFFIPYYGLFLSDIQIMISQWVMMLLGQSPVMSQ